MDTVNVRRFFRSVSSNHGSTVRAMAVSRGERLAARFQMVPQKLESSLASDDVAGTKRGLSEWREDFVQLSKHIDGIMSECTHLKKEDTLRGAHAEDAEVTRSRYTDIRIAKIRNDIHQLYTIFSRHPETRAYAPTRTGAGGGDDERGAGRGLAGGGVGAGVDGLAGGGKGAASSADAADAVSTAKSWQENVQRILGLASRGGNSLGGQPPASAVDESSPDEILQLVQLRDGMVTGILEQMLGSKQATDRMLGVDIDFRKVTAVGRRRGEGDTGR